MASAHLHLSWFRDQLQLPARSLHRYARPGKLGRLACNMAACKRLELRPFELLNLHQIDTELRPELVLEELGK